jgi:hypothetical protein
MKTILEGALVVTPCGFSPPLICERCGEPFTFDPTVGGRLLIRFCRACCYGSNPCKAALDADGFCVSCGVWIGEPAP